MSLSPLAGGIDQPPLSPAPYTERVGSDNDKAVQELQEMLSSSMVSRNKAETDKTVHRNYCVIVCSNRLRSYDVVCN